MLIPLPIEMGVSQIHPPSSKHMAAFLLGAQASRLLPERAGGPRSQQDVHGTAVVRKYCISMP